MNNPKPVVGQNIYLRIGRGRSGKVDYEFSEVVKTGTKYFYLQVGHNIIPFYQDTWRMKPEHNAFENGFGMWAFIDENACAEFEFLESSKLELRRLLRDSWRVVNDMKPEQVTSVLEILRSVGND